MKISMQLAHQYIAIFFNFSTTPNHLHPLQVENCGSNLRLVVDDDDNVKSGLKGLKCGRRLNPFSVGDRLYTSDSEVCRLQYKDNPHTVRVCIMAVDP